MRVNYAAAYWTPPMTPKLAFDLESRQIEKLDLAPMVSITDHDNIKAPMLLRTIPSARRIPVSVEWSAALRRRAGLSSRRSQPALAPRKKWMRTLAEFTANPNEDRLNEILIGLE